MRPLLRNADRLLLMMLAAIAAILRSQNHRRRIGRATSGCARDGADSADHD